MRFRDRQEAGKRLGLVIKRKYPHLDGVVYGLPRGGVITAFEVAKVLHVPLDIINSRKIGHPLQPEYGIAVVTEDGYISKNEREMEAVDQDWLEKQIQQKQQEIQIRKNLYAPQRTIPKVESRTALLVDDGIATGHTMEACIHEVKNKHPKKIIIAVPVGPDSVVNALRKEVDDIVVLERAEIFLGGISAYYEYFDQVSDTDVRNLLQ